MNKMCAKTFIHFILKTTNNIKGIFCILFCKRL